MDRRDFIKGVGGGLLSTVIAPELLAHVLISRYQLMTPSIPSHLYDGSTGISTTYAPTMRITVVGIGPFASRMAGMLARNLEYVTCLSLIFDPAAGNSADLSSVMTTVRQSDLLFIFSAFDDQSSRALFELSASTAHEAGVLTVGVIPEYESFIFDAATLEWSTYLTTLFQVSANSIHGSRNQVATVINGKAMLAGYALRHVVATIVNLITQINMICIDFADVSTILRAADSARMGVGVSGGMRRGRDAAMLALESLHEQQFSPEDIKAILASVDGGQLLTMDDYEDVSQLIHGYAREDVDILIGLHVEELMGDNARVTIMALV